MKLSGKDTEVYNGASIAIPLYTSFFTPMIGYPVKLNDDSYREVA